MRLLLILFFLTGALTSATGQEKKPLKTFFHQYKQEDEAFHLSIPGWLLRFGLALAGEKKELDEVELSVVKGIKKVQLLILENGSEAASLALNKTVKELKNNSFEQLLSFREEGARVNLMTHVKRSKVKNLLLFVNDETDIILINLKTRFPESFLLEHEDKIARAVFSKFNS